MKEKILFESSNDFLIAQICEMLKDNNIDYIKQEEGAGQYLNVALGGYLGVKKIFVSDEEYDKAAELLEIFDKQKEEIPEELRENSDDDLENIKEINKYNRMKRILFIWIPFTMVMIIVIMAIITSIF